MKIEGLVKSQKTKEWNGKTMYNLAIDDGNGEWKWYGFGLKNPGVREETRVTFEASQNQKGYWVGDASTIEVQKTPDPAPQAQGGGAAPQKSSGGFVDRQNSITLQTSFKVATDQVNGMLAAGLFKPAANSKAAKETAIEAYREFVKKVAAELHGYFMEPDKFEEMMLSGKVSAEDQGSDDNGEPFNDDIPFG